MRGLAALLVVVNHIPQWNSSFDIAIFNNGYLMVDLFFVLSGFVIFSAYGSRICSGRELAQFQFLRLGRLYPVHLLFLLVFAAIEVAKYIAQTRLAIASPNSVPFQVNNVGTFMQNIFLVQSVLPNRPTSFNIPSWSISVEFYM